MTGVWPYINHNFLESRMIYSTERNAILLLSVTFLSFYMLYSGRGDPTYIGCLLVHCNKKNNQAIVHNVLIHK